MHRYQIPKAAKNSQRGCNCPIRTPSDTLTDCYPPRQHREHSLWGYQHLLLCLQILNVDRRSVDSDFSTLIMIFPHGYFISSILKSELSDISLKFYHRLPSVEIRPSTADLYINTHSSSKGELPCNLLLNIFSLNVKNYRWISVWLGNEITVVSFLLLFVMGSRSQHYS